MLAYFVLVWSRILSFGEELTLFFLNTADGQQIPIKQDPNDPNKWQVVSTPQAVTPLQIPSVPTLTSPTQVTPETPTSGKRVRRVACTCPNCRDSEGNK